MRLFILLITILLIQSSSSSSYSSSSYSSDTNSPHHRTNPKSLLVPWKKRSVRRSRALEGGNPVLKTDVELIEANLSANVKVSYSGIEFTHSSDWIGMWPSETDLSIFSAPIKFKYVMPDPTKCLTAMDQESCEAMGSLCTWLPSPKSKCVPASPPSNGTVDFLVENMRTPVMFVYVRCNFLSFHVSYTVKLNSQNQHCRSLETYNTQNPYVNLIQYIFKTLRFLKVVISRLERAENPLR